MDAGLLTIWSGICVNNRIFPCILPCYELLPLGDRFVSDCFHHHPVVGFKLPPAYSHLWRQNWVFSHSLRVSGLVSTRDKSAFVPPSLHRKFPFPAMGGDWFDDWVVGLQFEPDHLHHPALANRTFLRRRQIGRFCGDFRPLTSRTWSLCAFTHFCDDFWRSVSASQNSVPGGRPCSSCRGALCHGQRQPGKAVAGSTLRSSPPPRYPRLIAGRKNAESTAKSKRVTNVGAFRHGLRASPVRT
jgi:hypothetical protein